VRLGSDLPIRLGFFLQRTGVPFPFRPGICYRGIDRLPFPPPPEEEEEIARSGTARLLSLWREYCDVSFTGELHGDELLTRRLRRAFGEEGIDLEIIYAEVVLIGTLPAGEDSVELMGSVMLRLRQLHDRVTSRPVGIPNLGYDVSYPLPGFHSALFQPGLQEIPGAPDFDLNSAGLLGTVDQVKNILPIANRMDSSWRPFCGIVISLIP